MMSDRECAYCGSVVQDRQTYCSPECKTNAKRERQYRREDIENGELQFPHLIDMSNEEVQDLLTSEESLQVIASRNNNDVDRTIRCIQGAIDCQMPVGWKAAPWLYYVRGRMVEIFMEEGLKFPA